MRSSRALLGRRILAEHEDDRVADEVEQREGDEATTASITATRLQDPADDER